MATPTALHNGSGSASTVAPAQGSVPSRALVGAIERAVVREQIRQQLPPSVSRAPTASTSSEDTGDELPPKTTQATSVACGNVAAGGKRRKTTYYMRKDETAQLQEQVSQLQAELEKSRWPPEAEMHSLVVAVARNAELQERVRLGDLTIASAQAVIASYGSECRSSPISGFIHLSADPISRQQTLTRMKEARMREATAYALTRSRFLNAAKFTRQVDSFETESGDFVTTHWEITPLEEAQSVQDAYRELLYFIETQEMSMSEKLGLLTIREGESEPVNGTQTVRMLSVYENGIQSETNVAVFSDFYDHSAILNRPHALVVVDFVDQDDLYPLQPQTRIRKDVASLTLITEAPPPSPGDRPVVTMVRWAFVRVNNNAYAKRRELEQVAREGVGKWCDVMHKCVSERLAWRSGES